ncbi:MAG: LacI family DNA-binding transcriptional regulator [Kordiimonas sp.]
MTTIRDVSRVAGVSVATVSRAMTRPEKVSEKTREKVLAAIAETKYKPDVSARNFSTRKSRTIVVLVPDISNPFFSRVIRGIEHTAQRVGYSVLLGDTRGDPSIEDSYAGMVEARLADGIIQLNGRLPFDGAEETPVPLVNACDCVDRDDIPTIALENAKAARAMTQHLLSLGHRRIAVVKGPNDSSLTRERLRGYAEALAEEAIELDDALIAEGDFSAASGENAATDLLSLQQKPTAIFCFNDEMAMGVMHHAKQLGFSVPADLSVVGFDDIQFAQYCDPPLTTIRQPAESFGSKAMTVLLGILQGEAPTVMRQHLPYEIVIRQSTGVAP